MAQQRHKNTDVLQARRASGPTACPDGRRFLAIFVSMHANTNSHSAEARYEIMYFYFCG